MWRKISIILKIQIYVVFNETIYKKCNKLVSNRIYNFKSIASKQGSEI
jgi:hypothetical protein